MVSSGNSTTATLGVSGSFTGATDDVTRYQEIDISIAGGPSNATGTFFFEFSPDGTNWDVSVSIAVTSPITFVPQFLRVVLPYFRVRYVNGGIAQTSFRMTVIYRLFTAARLTRFLNQSIDNTEPVENVRAIIGGQSPDGPFTNLPATGVVSSQSTNTNLGSGATFTGSAIVDMSGHLAISATLIANVNSATNGLSFNWYADSAGTRSLGMTQFTYGNAPARTSVTVPRQGPYFRITYLNGGTAQSSFELVTTLMVTAPPPDVLPISSTITGNNAAQIVKANAVGLQENGVYSNVGLSNSASLKVAVTDRPSEVRSRTAVIANIDHVTASTTIYTVTGGKTLYLQSIGITAINSSVTANGHFTIRDNTTIKIPFTMGQASSGQPTTTAAAPTTFHEPIPFTTNVNLNIVAGTLTASIYIIGYEE